MRIYYFVFTLLILMTMACSNPDPNTTKAGEDELKSLELNRALSEKDKRFEYVIYVPIYSDIYLDRTNQRSLLSATLSIRNTSFSDSLFIPTVDYYNTEGHLVRNYIEQPIVLSPMATVNYVIEKEDTSGGPGANFIVKLYSDNEIKPVIQAIMIGASGNKGFAFSNDGYLINKK